MFGKNLVFFDIVHYNDSTYIFEPGKTSEGSKTMDKICLVKPFMEYGDGVLVDPSDFLIVEV